MADNQPPIIIKKIKKGGDHGHHGGAWKLAYADFVTAMMAFFLLLWLLSATTDKQKKGIADYFAPTFASKSTSGANGVLGGNSITSDNGAQSSGSVVVSLGAPTAGTGTDNTTSTQPKAPDDNEINKAIAEREEEMFKDAEKELTNAIQNTPDLKAFADNLIIDRTPEGMRIQIVDQDRRSMFQSGSAEPLPRTKQILELVAKVIMKLPNRISISGHTDSTPYVGKPNYSNWELSADRANASRRVLLEAGVPASRIAAVKGMADTEPLFPEDPSLPSNRRISITLLREAPVLPPNYRQ
ncbi:MAG TPA: flagellar motor protein MotB [Alphaproteobacteria bacterium]|nr:flagellar motor protein MotB [Alphaproteobacteria bacterium]